MKENILAVVLALLALFSSSDDHFIQSFSTERNEFVYNCLQAERNKSLYSMYNVQLNVELLSSNHVLDQLITRIFAIILRDIFDYNNISINSYDFQNQTCQSAGQRVLHIFDLMEDQFYTPNKIVVHMSTWISTLAHNLIPDVVYELGSVVTPGRFGWFIPRLGIFQANSSQNAEIKLDSHILNDPHNKYYNYFVLNADALKLLEQNGDIEYKFNNLKCANRTCVTLLAEHRCDSNFIEQQIIDSDSYLNVFWLGSHFRQKINDLILLYEKHNIFETNTFIVLHWMPSDVINSRIQFLQFHMPKCEDMLTLQRSHCKYELTPILKYSTKPLQCNEDNQVIRELRKFSITDNLLKSLLEVNQNELSQKSFITSFDSYNEIACKWLKNNSGVYETHKETKIELYIGGIFPFSSAQRGHHNLSQVAEKAIEAINKNTTILSDYKLVLLENDCQCKADLVMKIFLHYYKIQNLLGVLGPACSETLDPIASLSKHIQMPIISYAADGFNFSNRYDYPYFFRTIGTNHQFIDVYLAIMEKFDWTRIATITEEGTRSTEYISHMETEINNRNYKLIENIKLILDTSASVVNKYLTGLKMKHTKVIIVDIYAQNLLNLILCESYKLKMTAYDGYVWFLPHWISKNITSSTNCSRDQLIHAFEGYFSIIHTPFGDLESIMQEGISVRKWLSDFDDNVDDNPDISQYAGFVYDAVWTYALAANSILKADTRPQDILSSTIMANHLAELIWKSDFQGLSGNVRFDKSGSRITTVSMMQWINNKSFQVGIFKPQIFNSEKKLFTRGGNLKISEHPIKWLWHNRQPNDGSYDCFTGELLRINCEIGDIFFGPTICVIFILITFTLSFFFWKRKYQLKIQSSVKMMKNFGIDFTALHYKKLASLNKWEIAKDKIVVNRRLGEGAFGKVYGGEAYLNGKGWVAVAIKTLKVGASIEDRLDFLSEADAMKCLVHENIIKMLGVCLQSEPIYTVMEYMLYGDLKTYLLARRNMANEIDFDENSDVSPKQLTTYALHIIKGLEYLANQKYIHRDIATRNCLVSAQRIVKLADFGMTKIILDTEYYRFSHKRMLPVRWMAPESLHSGLFTSASDIWSYGIVLFEIITFGALPYQGFTNTQVFQYVSKGNSLKLPLGIKQQLSSLIQACLSQEADKRPSAADIINYISNYPRLLTPSPDFPVTSIELVDSNKMEMVPDTQSMLSTTCYSDSYMSQSIPIKSFDRSNIFSGNVELSSFKTLNKDEDKCKPLPPSSFSITPEDGYSIMCPLLISQAKCVTNSPQEYL